MIRFELYRDTAGQHRFRIVAANGETIAQSEGYHNRQDALDTITAITHGAATAPIIHPTHPTE